MCNVGEVASTIILTLYDLWPHTSKHAELIPMWDDSCQVVWRELYGFCLLFQFLPHDPVINKHPVHFRIKVPFIPPRIEVQGSSPRMVSERGTKTKCWNVTIFQGFRWLNCPGTCWDVKDLKGMIIIIWTRKVDRDRYIQHLIAIVFLFTAFVILILSITGTEGEFFFCLSSPEVDLIVNQCSTAPISPVRYARHHHRS